MTRSEKSLEVPKQEGYQPAGTSWSPTRPDIRDLLRRSRQVEFRSIYYGSNACYLVKLSHPHEGESLGVYKPASGEYPLWDFPQGSLHRREVATYELDRLLGWSLVPPTVVAKGRFGVGSLQLFIEEATGDEVRMHELRRMALLDWVANNADRKPDHLILDNNGKLWGIDHGLTFHVHPKLRTVLWHFAGEPIDESEKAAIAQARDGLCSASGESIRGLLEPEEYRILILRIDRLISAGTFPNPRYKSVPYRW